MKLRDIRQIDVAMAGYLASGPWLLHIKADLWLS
jgi:hypothetical protein